MRAPDALAFVRIDDVGYAAGGMALLQGVDLTLPCDGITAIMGPNGAGKSTLLRLLAGLLEPTSGAIDWPAATSGEPVRRGFVFQRPVILRRTVAANIRHAVAPLKLPASKAAERLQAALEDCSLVHLADAPARRLSGGEQQRLAMARALARRPGVLLLDEPTASLDPAATAAIEQIVQRSCETGTRIILVTHDAGQARRLADDVVFLHAGRACEHTPAPAFFDTPHSQPARDYLAGRIPATET